MTTPLRCALLALLCVAPATSAQERLELAGLTWRPRGDWQLAEHLGRQAILLRNGALELEGVGFLNGTIEFEMAVGGHRSFAGVAFRVQNGGSYENFYVRPHESGRFDALQYTPVWNNATAWQLYPEHNAFFTIPRDEWFTVRLVVRDLRLEAYLGGSEEPAMVVDRLRGPAAAGRLAILAFYPEADERPGFYPNAFSGFRFAHDQEWREEEQPIEKVEGRVIGRWELSQAFPGSPEAIETYPADLLEQATWTVVTSEPSGRTNLAVPEGIPPGAELGVKLARVTLTSDRDRDVKLNYGFSDRGSLFLNGRLVLTGDNTYLSRSGRYLGIMTLDNDAVYLELRQGDNELLFAVTEAFGGWGLTARLGDTDGVRWRAGTAQPAAH